MINSLLHACHCNFKILIDPYFYSIFTFNKVGGVCTYTSDLSLTLSHEGVMVRQGDAIKVPNEVAGSTDVVTVPVTLLEIPATSLRKVEMKSTE